MTDKVDIWMPLYVRDYLGATSRLTTEQHGAYMLLIMDYWLNGPPPDDDAVLASIARLSLEQWSKHRPSIERLFSIHNGEWRHRRIDREIEAARGRKKQAIERGKAGAKARWGKENGASNRASMDEAPHKQSSKDGSSPSPSPSQSSTPEPAPSKSKDYGADAPLSSSQKREPDRSDEIQEVFAYWQERLNHGRAKLDEKRRKKIRDRLKDGYTVADLKDAIDGITKSPHHMGENESSAIYDDIELICRDGPHVDKFIKQFEQADMTSLSSAGRQTASAAQQWLKESENEDRGQD